MIALRKVLGIVCQTDIIAWISSSVFAKYNHYGESSMQNRADPGMKGAGGPPFRLKKIISLRRNELLSYFFSNVFNHHRS